MLGHGPFFCFFEQRLFFFEKIMREKDGCFVMC